MDRIITLAPSNILYYRLEDLGHADFAKETQITIMFGELQDTLGNIIYKLEDLLFSYCQTYRQKANNNRMANYMLREQPKILDALLRKTTPLALLEQKGFVQ